ncbi:hypothetical protein SAMN05216330_11059 [Bradyrhizobium sp. Ghvi]|nr:hypothetical protein SAMN05216330_11059 [Bradyrhizobium sp. Ghvi]
MAFDGLDRPRASLTLSNHCNKTCMRKHVLRELVHPRRSRWASRAHDFVSDRIYRTDIINDTIAEVCRQSLTAAQEVDQTCVRGVATG